MEKKTVEIKNKKRRKGERLCETENRLEKKGSQASRQIWCRRFFLTAVILQPTEFHQRRLHLSCAVGQRRFQVSFLWQVDLLVLKFVQITRHSWQAVSVSEGPSGFFSRWICPKDFYPSAPSSTQNSLPSNIFKTGEEKRNTGTDSEYLSFPQED